MAGVSGECTSTIMRWKRAPSSGLACSQSNRGLPFSASNAMPPSSAPSRRLQISPLYSVSSSADVRGTLFDLPEGVDAAKRGAGGPLPGVTFTAGDVFETVPEGADAYLFRHLLHDYDDDDCIKMLKNVRQAMKPDSRVLVLEKTVPTDDTPGPGRWLDLHVMLLTGGRERTVPEYQALFDKAGLKFAQVLSTAHPAVEVIEVVAAQV